MSGIAMFRVEATSPLDQDWVDRDVEILAAAGRPSEFHGGGVQHGSGRRLHVWTVGSSDEAEAMRDALSAVEGVDATVWEFDSGSPPPRTHHPPSVPMQPVP